VAYKNDECDPSTRPTGSPEKNANSSGFARSWRSSPGHVLPVQAPKGLARLRSSAGRWLILGRIVVLDHGASIEMGGKRCLFSAMEEKCLGRRFWQAEICYERSWLCSEPDEEAIIDGGQYRCRIRRHCAVPPRSYCDCHCSPQSKSFAI
jgi:hypothetical protein